jgi:two-component system, NarL family, sensor histidine kinase UhpB
MRLPQQSVAFLVALALAGSTAAVLVGFGYADYRRQGERLQAELEAEHAEMADRLAADLALALTTPGSVLAEGVMRRAMGDRDVAAISFVPSSAAQRPIVLGRSSSGEIVPLAEEPAAGHWLQTRPLYPLLRVFAPGHRARQSIGYVRVFVTPQLMQAQLAELRRQLVTNIASAEIVLLAALYLMLWLLVLRPVRFLERQASGIGRGERDLSRLAAVRLWGEPERLRAALVHTIELLKAGAEKLRVSEERFRLAMEGANDGLFDWDIEHDHVFYSPRLRELLGYDAGEDFPPKPRTFWAHIHRNDRHRVAIAVTRHMLEHAPYDVEYRLRHRSGDYRWFRSRAQAVWNSDGKATRMAGSISDIDDQKAAQESLRVIQDRELRAHEEFAQHLITAQEQERQRLANELHDSLGQSLSVIKNRAQLALEQTRAGASPADHLQGVIDTTVEGIAEVRALAQNLRPIHIERIGLTSSLQSLSSGVQIANRLEDVDDLIIGAAATHVYRIVQEALNNVIRHAAASNAVVALQRDLHCVRLTISDDGRGFEPTWQATHQGLGVTSMGERARILGGSLHIRTAPGAGTTLTIEIPMSENALTVPVEAAHDELAT